MGQAATDSHVQSQSSLFKNRTSFMQLDVRPCLNSSKVFSSVLRERFNFASAACAALVIYSSSGIKSPSAVLNGNKDVYMLVPCTNYKSFSPLKWLSDLIFSSTFSHDASAAISLSSIIVELCSELRIDTIVLSNEEYFSSSFKKVRLFGSTKYGAGPPDWKPIANLDASPIRGPQVFNLEASSSFVRYLKFEFESFYGHEFYCPVTFLAVYGTTMIDELRQEIAKNPTLSSNTSHDAPKNSKKMDHFVKVSKHKKYQMLCLRNGTKSMERPQYYQYANRNISSLLFETLDSNGRDFLAIFKNHPPFEASVLFEKNKSEAFDVISGNNIFKVIIDRIGFLESQTDTLSSRLLTSFSELDALRRSMLDIQKLGTNFSSIFAPQGHISESSKDPGAPRGGLINNLHDIVKTERFFSFWDKNTGSNGLLILLIFLFSFAINWWIFRQFSKKKETPSSSPVMGPSSSSPTLLPSQLEDASTLILDTPIQPPANTIMLDSEVMLFPTVDPSLTKSSLLTSNDHLLKTPNDANGDSHLASSPKSPLLMKGMSHRRAFSICMHERDGRYRSKSMPPPSICK